MIEVNVTDQDVFDSFGFEAERLDFPFEHLASGCGARFDQQ